MTSNNRRVLNMNVLNYNLRFRPVRIGWCLRNNDWVAYQKILKLNFITAGGQYNDVRHLQGQNLQEKRPDLLLQHTDFNYQ